MKQLELFDNAQHWTNGPLTFESYKKLQIRKRARCVDRMRHDRARKLFCDAMGFEDWKNFPANCVHNAAMDCERRTGWLKNATPEQISATKHANRMLNEWPASDIANKIYSKVKHV